jgi:hypothetical protein
MLPSQSVLASLYYPGTELALKEYFPNRVYAFHWTSSESIQANDVSWAKVFRLEGIGDDQGYYRGDFKPVRLVVMN